VLASLTERDTNVENSVVVGAGAKVLGNITIGRTLKNWGQFSCIKDVPTNLMLLEFQLELFIWRLPGRKKENFRTTDIGFPRMLKPGANSFGGYSLFTEGVGRVPPKKGGIYRKVGRNLASNLLGFGGGILEP